VIGISADPPERNLAWTKQLNLPFRLLSDGDGRTARAYGVWDTTWNLPQRVTFIVDRARRIRFMEVGGLAVDTSRTLEALGKLARAS
jgi:peroxiredoxin